MQASAYCGEFIDFGNGPSNKFKFIKKIYVIFYFHIRIVLGE